MFFAPHFNPLCAQLSILICNLSLSSNTMSLSCLLSHQRHCVSPLIEFWSYPLRCSCFSASYLMSLASLPSRVPHSFQICFHVWMVIFSQLPVTFLFAWHNARFSVSAFYVGLNILCHWLSLSCSSASDLCHTLVVIVQKVISISSFSLEGLFLEFNTYFSPMWLLVHKAVKKSAPSHSLLTCTISP